MTKVDIFSGFLGAGKTTLIQKLIKEAYTGEKLVLIENEFGEIGVDGTFLAEAGVEITEMNSGCICCSLVGDFGRALEKVVADYAPERILIEPSGVGKLSDVIRAVQNIGSAELKLNGFTTVVDAKKCRMYMKNFGEFFNNQIENASAIILSHTAGLSEAKIAECVSLLRSLNPDATIVTTDWNEITGAQILEAMEKKSTLESELARLAEETAHDEEEHHHHHDDDDDDDDEHGHHHHHDDDDEHECCHHHHHDDDEDKDEHEHHHHDGECCCGEHHHHHHADEVFTSWGRETAHVYAPDELEKILAALENESDYGMVLRAKGFVPSTDGWLYFDYVPGTPDVRRGSPAVTGRICVIGSKLNEEKLAELFGVR